MKIGGLLAQTGGGVPDRLRWAKTGWLASGPALVSLSQLEGY